MFDHVSIGVADIARSKKFYDAALKPLGFSRLSDGETSLGYGEKAVQLCWARSAIDARGAHAREEAAVIAAVASHAGAFAFVVVERGDDGHDDGVRFRRAGFHSS